MTLDADVIVDRRRLRRKLTFWRVLAGIGIAVALIVGTGVALGVATPGKSAPHIARIEIAGVITDNRKRLQLIEKLAKTSQVQGVIVAINSPGGSTTGGEGLVEALDKLRAAKPVVAHIGTVGASAGYMTAIAADHVVARRNSITGSIGVLFQYGNAEKLLDTLGVEMEAVKSAPLKAEPDFYSPAPPEAREMLASIVRDSYEWFVALVAERRGLAPATARALADGRIYTGQQALEARLIDALGGEEAATAWMTREKSLPAGLPVLDWREDDGLPGLSLAGMVSQVLGRSLAQALFGVDSVGKLVLPEALMLDGLVSVWHAPSVAEAKFTGGADQ